MYADDIFLMAPSCSMIRRMLELCCAVLKELDLCINSDKSVFMRFGPRWSKYCAEICTEKRPLKCVMEAKYLGVYITSGVTLSVSFEHIKSKFYRTFNAIYSKSKYAVSDLCSVELLKAYCLPILLYGIESFYISSSMLAVLNKPITRAIGRIFGTYDLHVINNICYIVNLDLACLIRRRKTNFVGKFFNKNLAFSNVLYEVAFKPSLLINRV